MQGDVHQSALAGRVNVGHAGDGLLDEPAPGVDEPQPAGPLADQRAAVGQEDQRPGVFERTGEGLDLGVLRGNAAGKQQEEG